jgi:alcohol dehydrogenase
MKAVFIERFGDNGVVRYGDVPEPTPGPTELLVKVHAASVNPLDFKIRSGKVKALIRYQLPLVLGNDLSGVVQSVGSSVVSSPVVSSPVRSFRPGDAVFARLDKRRIGAFAEYAVVDMANAAPKPKSVSHVEAASVPLVGLTSWQALVELGGVSAGQKVLIHAGAGGVGTIAIQIAKHRGAEVATTASPRNEALVRSFGADHVIDYRKQRFEDVLSGYDFVFDTIGGDTLLRSFRVLRRGGVLVSVAALPSAQFARGWGMPRHMVWLLGLLGWKVSSAARRHGVRYEFLFMRADGEQLGQLGALIDGGVLRPVVKQTFPLERTADALAFVESGRAEGKVVIEVVPASASKEAANSAAGNSSSADAAKAEYSRAPA